MTKTLIAKTQGVTLVELLVSLAMISLVGLGIYAALNGQLRASAVVHDTALVQQDIRASLNTLVKEIRMTGYDPSGSAVCGNWIDTADANNLQIEMDLNGDGDCDDTNERITFAYSSANRRLSRNTDPLIGGEGSQVDCFQFTYVLADGTETSTPSATQLSSIRVVKIQMVVRSAEADPQYTNSETYPICGPFNDNYRRRYLEVAIAPRNLGL